MNFDEILGYGEEIYETLIELIKTPGPSLSCARIINGSEKDTNGFPISEKVKEIVNGFERSSNIKIFEDHGNLVLVGGLSSKDPRLSEIRNIPIVLGAHLDEITYLISNKTEDDRYTLIPLCSPPTKAFSPDFDPFHHKEAKVLRLINGELKTIGYGTFSAEPIIGTGRDRGMTQKNWKYLLKVERPGEIQPGDVAIQNYGKFKKYEGTRSVIEAKALDDRVGTVAVLYAFRFLSKIMPIKAILSGDEEGVPLDVSWARLILPTYRRFCKNDVITILCDGINGADITEFPNERGRFLSDAILLPYTAEGKGGGDYRLFSLIREKVIPICKKNKVNIRIMTDYASRSFDPKIMNEYPLIAFIDWSNGLIGNRLFRCHHHEEVLFEQVLNIIGSIFWTCKYLSENPLNL